MSAELEIMGITKVEDAEWDQPRDEVVDVSAYTDAAVVCTIFGANVAGGTTSVFLDTAVDDAEERWVGLAKVTELTASVSSPETHYLYLQGPGTTEDEYPGFARYLRVAVDQDGSSDITLDVRAIMKTKGGGGGMPGPSAGMMPPGMGADKLPMR